MAKQAKKAAPKQTIASKANTLESITGADALAILKVLAARDANLAQEIDAVAKELFRYVEIDEMAVDVQMELESLSVEDIWDRSGTTRDGYVDPGEAASEMLEEALKPFRDEVDKYKRLAMLQEADLACQGILKGIYNFHKDSSTEYKEWAVDAPSEYFGVVLDHWKKLLTRRTSFPRMTAFLQTHCPDWAERATKSLRSRRP
jgi:hypothetical protein